MRWVHCARQIGLASIAAATVDPASALGGIRISFGWRAWQAPDEIYTTLAMHLNLNDTFPDWADADFVLGCVGHVSNTERVRHSLSLRVDRTRKGHLRRQRQHSLNLCGRGASRAPIARVACLGQTSCETWCTKQCTARICIQNGLAQQCIGLCLKLTV